MGRALRTLLSWSGGKDCALALHELLASQDAQLAGLLTTVNESAARVSIHGSRIELVRQQAARLGLPLLEVALPDPCSNRAYEQLMGAALSQAAAEGVEAVAFGDISLRDVREYRETQLARLGLKAIFPIFGRATSEVAQAQIGLGIRAILTCVDQRRLPGHFAGRRFDASLLAELPLSVDPCGESGEFHTLVWDSPDFSDPLAVVPGPVVERGEFVFADLQLGREPHSADREASGSRP